MSCFLNMKRILNVVRLLNNNFNQNFSRKPPILTLLTNDRAYITKLTNRYIHLSVVTYKHNEKSTSKKTKYDSDDDDDNNYESIIEDERDSKVVKSNVNSLRVDALIKAGLNIARNKIENIFYESRIRVNGSKINKKSLQVNEGDEIDIIRSFSQSNPSNLIISRIVVLSVAEGEDGFNVHLRRYKNMLIENYSGAQAYKSSISGDKNKIK